MDGSRAEWQSARRDAMDSAMRKPMREPMCEPLRELMHRSTHDASNAPLYARVGRQSEGPLHGTLVPLHQAAPEGARRETREPQAHSRRLIVVMAALAVSGVVALGAQLTCAAARSGAARQGQNVGAGLATATGAQVRSALSPAADARAPR